MTADPRPMVPGAERAEAKDSMPVRGPWDDRVVACVPQAGP
ncbi:hypothetical protein ACFTXM_39420 [Streptomyces sp. NPDC056930]